MGWADTERVLRSGQAEQLKRISMLENFYSQELGKYLSEKAHNFASKGASYGCTAKITESRDRLESSASIKIKKIKK